MNDLSTEMLLMLEKSIQMQSHNGSSGTVTLPPASLPCTIALPLHHLATPQANSPFWSETDAGAGKSIFFLLSFTTVSAHLTAPIAGTAPRL